MLHLSLRLAYLYRNHTCVIQLRLTMKCDQIKTHRPRVENSYDQLLRTMRGVQKRCALLRVTTLVRVIIMNTRRIVDDPRNSPDDGPSLDKFIELRRALFPKQLNHPS